VVVWIVVAAVWFLRLLRLCATKIATSPAVRAALTARPGLKELLRTMDGLEGSAREEALQSALGVSRRDVGRSEGGVGVEIGSEIRRIDEEERYAMRGLAEAIEAAVRGSRGALFGLDWLGS
jgi:hypothetical protein